MCYRHKLVLSSESLVTVRNHKYTMIYSILPKYTINTCTGKCHKKTYIYSLFGPPGTRLMRLDLNVKFGSLHKAWCNELCRLHHGTESPHHSKSITVFPPPYLLWTIRAAVYLASAKVKTFCHFNGVNLYICRQVIHVYVAAVVGKLLELLHYSPKQ